MASDTKCNNTTSSNALKRLMRDYKELRTTFLDTICAAPLESNMFIWHANLVAPKTSMYRGMVIHLEMNFPEDYPNSPPKVQVCTELNHGHVYNGYICLDMLRKHRGHSYSWGAWSSAYSVLSILRQLQIFFLEYASGHGKTPTPVSDRQKSLQYQCSKCGHDVKNGNPYPWDPKWKPFSEMRGTGNTLVKEKVDVSDRLLIVSERCQTIPDDCLLIIFSFLSVQELPNVAKVNDQWSHVSLSPQLIIARETICFHSKMNYEETVLGYGINLEFTKAGILQTVTSPLDLISREAFFEDKVRLSVWHQPFTYFFPLYINKIHAQKAIPLMESAVRDIYRNIQVAESSSNWVNLLADLLCKLMSSMVVEIMKGQMHASFVALEGYCAFHRWLIYLVEQYPTLLTWINNTVRDFINSENNRHKLKQPNLGEFLPLLSVSDYSWDDVSKAVVSETLDRNSLWISLKNPALKKPDSLNPNCATTRVKTCFEVCQVSARLIMFHKFFLTQVAKRHPTLTQTGLEYDNRFGKPSEDLQLILQQQIFDIMKIVTYSQYFTYVGYGLPQLDIVSIDEMIKEAMRNALKKGYLNNNQQAGNRTKAVPISRNTHSNGATNTGSKTNRFSLSNMGTNIDSRHSQRQNIDTRKSGIQTRKTNTTSANNRFAALEEEQ